MSLNKTVGTKDVNTLRLMYYSDNIRLWRIEMSRKVAELSGDDVSSEQDRVYVE